MQNIYEYGSETIQDSPNLIWKGYELILESLDIVEDDVSDNRDMKKGKKVTGAIIAELFRKNIEIVLKQKYEGRYKVSENNVYVKGCHIEFDFLILRQDAKKEVITQNDISYELPVYDSEDVVAVLESKTYGIYTLYDRDKKIFENNNLYKFVSAYKDDLHGIDKKIKLGYMCLAEQRPINGKSNFIKKTIYFFEDYFNKQYSDSERLWNVYFAKCHYAINNYDEYDVYAEEKQWERFVDSLLPESGTIGTKKRL